MVSLRATTLKNSTTFFRKAACHWSPRGSTPRNSAILRTAVEWKYRSLCDSVSSNTTLKTFGFARSLDNTAITTAATTVNHRPASSIAVKDHHDHHHHQTTAVEEQDNRRSKQQGSRSYEVNPVPDFNDSKAAYESKSNGQLLRGLLSFNLCRVPFLVTNAEVLLNTCRRLLGDTVTDALLKVTLYGHFCAGEDEKRIAPTVHALESAGIGSILDFAAEDDGSGSTSGANQPSPANGHDNPTLQTVSQEDSYETTLITRIYDYESEKQCDEHVEIFKESIRLGNRLSRSNSDGFAAVKVTSLTNPNLLARMSRAIVETRNLFAHFDSDQDGFIGRDEFDLGHDRFFKGEDHALKDNIEQLLVSNKVDYIGWSMLLSPRDLPRITADCREVGPLSLSTPTEEELQLMDRLYERGHALAQEAADNGTRLLIDAEQVRFQPAIDNLVLDLQRTFNATDVTDHPVIYNTYQCYLQDVSDRLTTDVERSRRFDYHFGAKLVRGAYMESERELAEAMGYPSPICETIQDTHDSYNDAVAALLQHAAESDQHVELMLATHNQESIEYAIRVMNDLGIDRRGPTISFAQLLGMKDNLTYNLGRNGYRAYKYVPYGSVKMVMPYLVRRANENSSIAGGALGEISMIKNELSRRLMGA